MQLPCQPRWAASTPRSPSSWTRQAAGSGANELGGFEEDIGCGFAMLHIIGADDGIEEVFDAYDGEGLLDDAFPAAAGDGEFAVAFFAAGDGDHDPWISSAGDFRGFLDVILPFL